MFDSKQAAQVLANRERIRHGRLRTVTLIRNDGGATAYVAAQCTWKEERNESSGAANPDNRRRSHGPDATAEFAPDVDLSGVVAIADTPDSAQVARARKVPRAGTSQIGVDRHAQPHCRQTRRDKVMTHANRR